MNDPFTWHGTPIITYIFDWTPEESKRFQDELMRMHLLPWKSQMGPVKFLKSKLGKQKFTWMGSESRQWIWESKNWRMFASNKQGMAFEVKLGLTKEEVREAWDDFRKRIGSC